MSCTVADGCGLAPCTAYLRGDPMSEEGGVGLLPALCRRRTACRRNVLRSRRNMTVSSLPGAVSPTWSGEGPGPRWGSEMDGVIKAGGRTAVQTQHPAWVLALPVLGVRREVRRLPSGRTPASEPAADFTLEEGGWWCLALRARKPSTTRLGPAAQRHVVAVPAGVEAARSLLPHPPAPAAPSGEGGGPLDGAGSLRLAVVLQLLRVSSSCGAVSTGPDAGLLQRLLSRSGRSVGGRSLAWGFLLASLEGMVLRALELMLQRLEVRPPDGADSVSPRSRARSSPDSDSRLSTWVELVCSLWKLLMVLLVSRSGGVRRGLGLTRRVGQAELISSRGAEVSCFPGQLRGTEGGGGLQRGEGVVGDKAALTSPRGNPPPVLHSVFLENVSHDGSYSVYIFLKLSSASLNRPHRGVTAEVTVMLSQALSAAGVIMQPVLSPPRSLTFDLCADKNLRSPLNDSSSTTTRLFPIIDQEAHPPPDPHPPPHISSSVGVSKTWTHPGPLLSLSVTPPSLAPSVPPLLPWVSLAWCSTTSPSSRAWWRRKFTVFSSRNMAAMTPQTPMGPLALCLSTNRREGEEEPEQQQQQRARFTRRGDVKLRHDREDAVDLKP
ncbi:hypothetical protein F7725_008459 [Dissostichus mawsoni]|uniref:Uncharacterized protein n=1 Tax=Dissostichus mawsoni TaxID=36200 RepID=A0A7J5Y789_DISMA|nr:hypothetical protein F7725_008459 [Dissostichus mawsoni]